MSEFNFVIFLEANKKVLVIRSQTLLNFDVGNLEFLFKPSFPASLICVGSRLQQISVFWSERSGCRHRKMSWTMSKRRAFVFVSEIEAGPSVK